MAPSSHSHEPGWELEVSSHLLMIGIEKGHWHEFGACRVPSPKAGTGPLTLHVAPGQVDGQLHTKRIPGFCLPYLSCPIYTRYLLRSPNPPRASMSPANPVIGANHSLIMHLSICVSFPLLVLAQLPESLGYVRAGTPPLHHCLKSVCHPCKQSFLVVPLETYRHPAP